MPEANILYTVTAVIVAGLVVWVLAALKMAKQPWAIPEAQRAALAAAAKKRDADVPVEKPEETAEEKVEEKPEEKTDEAPPPPAENEAEEEKKDDEEKKAEA